VREFGMLGAGMSQAAGGVKGKLAPLVASATLTRRRLRSLHLWLER